MSKFVPDTQDFMDRYLEQLASDVSEPVNPMLSVREAHLLSMRVQGATFKQMAAFVSASNYGENTATPVRIRQILSKAARKLDAAIESQMAGRDRLSPPAINHLLRDWMAEVAAKGLH